jgi:hypothetical protein
MFIQGHIEIIQDILDNHLPKNFFKFIDHPTDKKFLKNLFIGMQSKYIIVRPMNSGTLKF